MKRLVIPFLILLAAPSYFLAAGHPFFAPDAAAAEEGTFPVHGQNFMPVSLERYIGKKVALRLSSGEELSGTLRAVGQHGVHLAELQGREFFDALIRTDQIAAVIVKAK